MGVRGWYWNVGVAVPPRSPIGLQDPRGDWTKRHDLMDIMAIAIYSVVCSADSWVDVEQFGNSKKDWLSNLLRVGVAVKCKRAGWNQNYLLKVLAQ